MREDDLKDFSAFLREFQGETDRGAALVGAALLDQRLLATLKAFLVPSDASEALLEGGGNAPLGTLSARTKAAFALGLIDSDEFKAANLIRKIRNEFAHRVHGTTFQDSKIMAMCHAFQCSLPGDRRDFLTQPRFMFINATILTVLNLTYRAEWVSKEQRTTRRWP